MSANNTFLAVFLGSKTNSRMTAWNALPEAERLAKQKEGIAAWKEWAEKHQSAVVGMGGPLGKTKKVTQHGIEDTSNEMGAFTVVRAASHEAAAKLFEKHRVQLRPDFQFGPFCKSTPASTATAAVHFDRQRLPGNTRPEDKHDARQRLAIRHPWSSA